MTKSLSRIIGDAGEEQATKHLRKKGFGIIERNYLRKWGEIDIIAKKNNVLYFVEVKTITSNFYINREDWYKPEDKVHHWKIKRLKRAIQTYLSEKKVSDETEWEFSIITVILKRKTRELYKLEHLENLII